MRSAFSAALVEAGLRDPRVLLLTGDHGYALFDDFRGACPRQYLNAGVAEQNMVGVAAGLAKGGFRPVVYGLSAFVPVDRKSTRLNSSHANISYAVFCLKKKNQYLVCRLLIKKKNTIHD